MAHFTVCVLLNNAPKDMDAAIEHVNTVLEKYDVNRELPEYRRYFSEEDVALMRKHCNLPNASLNDLLPHVEDWEGYPVAVDEHGLYETTTSNPDGLTDYWTLMEILPAEGRDAAILTEERFPKAIVTPDGEWINGPWVYSTEDEQSRKLLEDWIGQVKTLLAAHPTATACLVDCHV